MRWTAVLGAVGLAACTTLTGLDRLGEVPCVTDCGASLDAAAEPDAASEATMQDTRADAPRESAADAPGDSAQDASVDSQAEADAGPDGPLVRWCSTVQPTPLFCEDFDDDHGVLTPPWDDISVVDGGEVSLSTSQFSSPPDSLYSTAPGGNGVCNDANVSKAFASPFSQADLSFDLFIVDTDSGLVAGLWFGPSYSVQVALGQAQSYVQQNDVTPSTFDNFAAPPLVGAWARVAIHIALTLAADGGTPSSGAVTVSIDGSVVHTTAIDADKIANAYGAPAFFVGVACNNHGVPRVLYVDNVVFDTQ